jgi:hypothetical protein
MLFRFPVWRSDCAHVAGCALNSFPMNLAIGLHFGGRWLSTVFRLEHLDRLCQGQVPRNLLKVVMQFALLHAVEKQRLTRDVQVDECHFLVAGRHFFLPHIERRRGTSNIHVSKAAKRGTPGPECASVPATQPPHSVLGYSMAIGLAGP